MYIANTVLLSLVRSDPRSYANTVTYYCRIRDHKLTTILVWIYGGGFSTGDKSVLNGGGPSGLIHRSNDSIIYVALNYRLGAFGWLSGPTFQQSGTANAGLHDQQFALKWVQKYIHLFGGDPGKVTVMGQSAGGT